MYISCTRMWLIGSVSKEKKSTRNTMVVVPDSNEHNPRGLRVAKPLTIGVDKKQSLIHRKNRSVHYNQPTI